MEALPKELLITEEDERNFEKNVEYIEDKFSAKLEKTKKRISFVEDVVALYKYIKDDSVNWYRKLIVVASLVYFISPIDTIPDFAPFVGYLDDLGVIMAALKYIGTEIKPYYRVSTASKNIELENDELLF
ncbi:MAG: DUF1232 domain-containing protein [Bacteroidetes bacterium]|nr:DUF1232 domain-containing protein [Bacteroidota bacterium]MBU2585103.1 DUF1232 domain-containing protein [Bacteroidota bacterium]